MIAEQLKKSILQAAIQGKLTKQLPEDGDARDLLTDIQHLKAQLIKEGKIKKGKTLQEINEDEILFQIPENWIWVRLSECLDVRDGTHNTPKYASKGVPLITSKNLVNGVIDFSTANLISIEDANAINLRSGVDEGDILFAMIGSIGNPAIVHKDREFSIKNVALFKNINNLMNMNYVYYFLLYAQDFMKTTSSGGVQAFVSLNFLRTSIIPLPPIAEQKRIVDCLEKVLPEIDNLRKDETELDSLQKSFPKKMKDSILQYAVQGKLTEQLESDGDTKDLLNEIQKEKIRLIKEGKIKKEKSLPEIKDDEKPFDIPENWCWIRLGSIGYSQTGTTPDTSRLEYYGNDIPFIKPPYIFNDHIEYDKEGLSKLGIEKSRLIVKNSILMVCIGGSTGKTYYCDRDVCCNQQINTLTTFTDINVGYVLNAMQSQLFQKKLWQLATGTATTIVNKENWRQVLIPLPPIAEQERIVERLEQLLPLCNKID
jgi:type I restriction enzyme, S subunit